MTGATGVTGPTAPNVTSNYMTAFNADPQFVAQQGIIRVPNIFTNNGTAINNVNGVITLAGNQTYSISYTASGNPPVSGGMTGLGAALRINGTTFIPGGSAFNLGNPTTNSVVSLAGSTILTTTGPTSLALVNITSVGGATFNNADMNVVKIA